MASLGSDLAAIRKDKGISFEDLQHITKLSPRILKSIEDNSIFDEFNSNTTYKRSYVRNYGKALNINEKSIVKALNKVTTDEYQGFIRKKYEDSINSEIGKDQTDESGNEENEDEMVHDHSPEYSAEEKADKTDITNDRSNGRDRVSSIDWVSLGQKSSEPQKASGSKRWPVILGIVVLTAIIVFLYFYFAAPSNSEAVQQPTETSVEQQTISSDTIQESFLAPSTSKAPQTTATLPDTLIIEVIAATGKLNPVRVYTDIMGIRRPYWVELHDTLRFEFVNIFRVQAVEKYDRLEIMINGHTIKKAYDQFYNPESEMIELDRNIIEAHPKWQIPKNKTAKF